MKRIYAVLLISIAMSGAVSTPGSAQISDFDNYNQRPTWMLNLHAALDRAVWDSCGWPEDEVPANFAEEVILERVLGLNGEKAGMKTPISCQH